MFLKRTGQISTLSAGITVTLIGGMLTFGSLISAFRPEEPVVFITFVLAGLTLVFAGSAWLCFRIKCPQCGARIFWQAVSGNSVGEWDRDLWGTACPSCGYEP
jgi:hypothetical protein